MSLKDVFQAILCKLKSLFTFFVLIHSNYYKMQHFATS